MFSSLRAYRSSIILLGALLLGGLFGGLVPELAIKLKPIGQIFLNLLFMIIVPLVAVSVMSSIAHMTDLKKLGAILVSIMLVSIVMAIIPAVGVVLLALAYDPAQGVTLDLANTVDAASGGMDFVSLLTTNDFVGLLSKSNILALIIMSVIGGVAIGQSGEDGQRVGRMLDSLNTVIMKVISLLMYVAPIGLGAYFAATMASQDTELMGTFARAVGLFFVAMALYITLGSTLYAWIGGGVKGVKQFWQHMLEPAVTALGTSSSLATLPVTIRSAAKMGLNEQIAEISLPLLVNLNKGGAAAITALKIVFIYSLLGLDFTPDVFMLTILISVLSAFIIGGVPGGAFLGEIFIVTTLGLPMEVIPILVVIGAITDAASTVINVVHDLTATQIIQRINGKHYVPKILDSELSEAINKAN
ncbi:MULTISPECIES: dicarboxylate/amino acid:cation symporter [Shewanella]|jgi:Na+/H+-dicarboxylate symporter|uniref:dicarboxylate/amino acid:cation symporter n=1 Tax=Shewanella TaxID=22 RepID=UPI000C50FF77|nr:MULTISPECIES: dicarboxylate/amino acid:cation symporter [Shewanella]NCQ44185.1 dicarboxylate/amino acid:cation symporter [Shewanella frigidimarina]MBB1475022.1 dicarboxylate/amino acid:cation symporter [Shewanella sp. SG41-3]NCO71112.1 dicarboxylate/amino acid:cation symporter [Shewanella vesiculosa]NCP35146.1 dicarboxylate/amino acid:cation symporter [Shewanella vesiculosa]NCP71047.1 dicarboxylate/amino acid:cation symporter [Shewanella vesiculosa]|tara:strand:- start:7257 stop:8504 length:1248 start_codon:yes stop_codon:yes gene_type:complete